ncbi:hypothetical protein [Anabaena sp. UHCC 0399]|uniref:hypothetical protein n=1 Tax=Anabaena sp. UHCC 0399 TaxID=3110238 RepID=UPI002B2084D6|nr:hypothetical protein [Anabaena sp. UHCC 0399]MEA5564550.1 hypothetical protein [Anabaena sp. UHCC 0399]
MVDYRNDTLLKLWFLDNCDLTWQTWAENAVNIVFLDQNSKAGKPALPFDELNSDVGFS